MGRASERARARHVRGQGQVACGSKSVVRVCGQRWDTCRGKDGAGVEAGSRFVGGKGEARVIARVGHEWGMCRGEIEVPMGERASYMFSTTTKNGQK